MPLTKYFRSDLPLGGFDGRKSQLPLNFIHEEKQFILKDIIPGDFDYIISLQKHVEPSPHVRTAVDSIPERHMFVFLHLEKGLLHVDTTALSSAAKKVIIRDALTGLADLHDEHIIHTDIKPANTMMDSFKQQNGDLEWCNAIFAWITNMVFFTEKANRASPEEQAKPILSRHLSFFTSSEEDFDGFIAYHGGENSPFIERIKELCKTLSEENPGLPFETWQQADPQFRDLVCKMTCLDPFQRIAAREALQHPWFAAE
ncbi:kinase-like domain-containing protein [Xylariaceae sp. FL1651]|nr:kinase-like domain-containing protein [Xylariaceae sp. FL1651]